jgi:hypothetical protein
MMAELEQIEDLSAGHVAKAKGKNKRNATSIAGEMLHGWPFMRLFRIVLRGQLSMRFFRIKSIISTMFVQGGSPVMALVKLGKFMVQAA